MNYQKRVFVLGILDSSIALLAMLIAYMLRFDFSQWAQFFQPVVVVIFVACTLLGILAVRMYARVWQYASVSEMVLILKAILIADLSFFLVSLLVSEFDQQLLIPRSIYVMAPVLTIAGLCSSRLIWRVIREPDFKAGGAKEVRHRVLIIGAGSAGLLVVKELRNTDSCMMPVAYIDDDPGKQHLEVLGLPIIGNRHHIPDAVERLQIDNIVVAIPSASKVEISKILEICRKTSATVKILPYVTELIREKTTTEQIRDVLVEDLLGREPVQVNLSDITVYLSEQVVLVTGAGGSIGSEICRQIASYGPAKLLLLGHGENSIFEIDMELRKTFPDLPMEPIIADIQDVRAIQAVFELHQPAVVFHAAAHKHVPLMEKNPLEAIKNNVLGTRNVAQSAHEAGCSHFVMISSDKAVNPTSVMGATKRLAELIIQGLNLTSTTKFTAVRFGNVLGSRGSVIPQFKRQIQEGGPVTVTHPEMVRYFMTIKEAVQLVIQAGALAQGGEVFILDMGEPVKIVDLAKDLIRLSGFIPDVEIPIAFTGIRPGEKLFEELLTSAEGITATQHNSIFVSRPTLWSWERVREFVEVFEAITKSPKASLSQEYVKQLVLQFVPEMHRQAGFKPVERNQKVTL